MSRLCRGRESGVVRYRGVIRLLASTRTFLLVNPTVFAGIITRLLCCIHLVPLPSGLLRVIVESASASQESEKPFCHSHEPE